MKGGGEEGEGEGEEDEEEEEEEEEPEPEPEEEEDFGSEIDEEDFTAIDESIPAPPQDLLVGTTTCTSNNQRFQKKMQKKRDKAAGIKPIPNPRPRGKRAPRPAPVPNPRSATAAIDSSEEEEEEEEEVAPPRPAKRGADAVGGREETAVGPRKRATRRVIPPTQEEEEEGHAFTSWVAAVRKDVPNATREFLKECRNKAKAVGGRHAVQEWRELFCYWRANMTLRSRPNSQCNDHALVRAPSTESELVEKFCHVYRQITQADTIVTFRAIARRCQMVELDDYYRQVAGLATGERRTRGKKKISEGKQHLFDLLYPQFQGLGVIPAKAGDARAVVEGGREPSREGQLAWNRFTTKLASAKRWKDLTVEFGFGILGLIPEAQVGNKWVEKGLKNNAQFQTWLGAIRRFNPGCKAASEGFSRRLVRGLQGLGPPSRLQLEDITDHDLGSHADPQALFSADADAPSEDDGPDRGLTKPDDAIVRGQFYTLVQPFTLDAQEPWINQGIMQMGSTAPILQMYTGPSDIEFGLDSLSQDSYNSWASLDSTTGYELEYPLE